MELLKYTGVTDTKTGNRIYEGDNVRCYDNGAMDETWGLDKVHTGIIVYTDDFYLKIGDNYLQHWSNAENIEII